MHLRLVPILGCLAMTAVVDAADDPHLLFYCPFDSNTTAVVAGGLATPYTSAVTNEPGKVGNSVRTLRTYQALTYDGRGNIDLNRGTVAFYFRPNFDVVEDEWAPILNVGTDIEGYWNHALDLIRIDQMLFSQLFDVGRYTRRLGMPIVGRWKKGEWVHLAVTWDRQQGIRVYENGEEKASSWGNHRWHWNQVPSYLNLNGGYYSTQDANWDEFRIYSRALPATAIVALIKGETPKVEPVPLLPAAEYEKTERDRYGWTAEDVKSLPVAGSAPLEFKWARIERTVDCKRPMAQPFEGFPATCWPHARYGASISGKQLEIYFAPDVEYDRMRLFAQRPFSGRLAQPQSIGDPKVLTEVKADRPIWRTTLKSPLRSPLLLLQRDDGWIGQVDFYQCREAKSPKVSRTLVSGNRISRLPDTEAGMALKSGLSPHELRGVNLTAGEAPGAWTLHTPAFEGFQMLSEPLTNSVPLQGLVVKLDMKALKSDTAFSVKVREPVWQQREWCNADLLARAGTKEITLVLRPRPLLTRAGEPLAIEVVADSAIEWKLGKGRCTVGLIEGSREHILPVHIADQMEFIREAFSEMSEGHVFDYAGGNRPMWGRLSRPCEAFNEIAPDHPVFMQLKRRLGWEKERKPYPTPANPSGAPEWALWQQETLSLVKQLVHWIIDNRQISNGEFGGVWGDDTDMVENWMGIWFASDDDDKIKNSVRLLMDGVWKYNLEEGVSATVRDELHSYEEGSGTISQRLLLDYGNPTAVERVMTACTHYPKWAKKAADGKWDFVSWYFGAKGAWTHGSFGQKQGGYLMLIQACYLAWYNRHPAVTDILVNWRKAGENPGMPTDAAYELTRSPELYKVYEKLVNEPNARYGGPIAEALCVVPSATVNTSALWQAAAGFRGLESASTNFPTTIWGIGSMHVPTEAHYLAWKATGDIKYLTDGFKMVCQHLNEQMWLYTGALPSTDRCPPPSRALIRSMLGSRPSDRGGDSNFWPRHAVSYERGADNLAALVTENTEKTIKALFWAFDAKEHPLRLRVWRLPPGEYKLGLYDDPEGDGKPNATIKEWTAKLERYSPVDLVLPPRKQLLFTIDPIKTTEMNYDRPDLAIGPEDVYLEYASGHLHVTVHNIGIKPVENIVLHAIDADTGVLIDTAKIERLEAPLDLKARKEKVEFHNLDSRIHKRVEVVIDPEGKIDELTKFNNRLTYTF